MREDVLGDNAGDEVTLLPTTMGSEGSAELRFELAELRWEDKAPECRERREEGNRSERVDGSGPSNPNEPCSE